MRLAPSIIARTLSVSARNSTPGTSWYRQQLKMRRSESASFRVRQAWSVAAAGSPTTQLATAKTRMRYVDRDEPEVETALGRVWLLMGRYACDGCGKGKRPCAEVLDIECSMTPGRSLAGSSLYCAEADGLLTEPAGVNYGAKRIERTTRLVGDDLGVAPRDGAVGLDDGARPAPDAAPAHKPLREDEILCVALDVTGVPARPRRRSAEPERAAVARAPGRRRSARCGGWSRTARRHTPGQGLGAVLRGGRERGGRRRWPADRSGRVEAACKTVVGRLLKCTGMRWTVAGANPIP